MVRLVAGIVGGAVVWFVAVALLGRVLVFAWPDFAAVKDWTLYTTPMLAARLLVGAISSILGGYVAAWISRDGFRGPFGSGVLLLLCFVPYHVLSIWSSFPVWYHLTFFVSLPALSLLGGRLRPAI